MLLLLHGIMIHSSFVSIERTVPDVLSAQNGNLLHGRRVHSRKPLIPG